jgi:cellulose synthase/poly-beta-1,6-N-acetylglucosamine synthase-like glycosyltransferase
MNEEKPSINLTFSVIVPVAPGGDVSRVTDSVANINYPADKFEILVSEGKQPSRQRNLAAQQAKGNIIYFLDNDSDVTPELFNKVVECYTDPIIASVGGPNLTSPTDSDMQFAFGNALGSFFAHSSMAARYRPIGKIRESGEKELILCNLSVRREVFLSSGGFDESLYPNEENEFMNRLQQMGYKLIYHPEAFIYRSRRKDIFAFFRQLMNYGRGRMEQALVEMQWKDRGRISPPDEKGQNTLALTSIGRAISNSFFLLPFFFSLYLISLPITVWYSSLALIPFVLYGILSIISAGGFAFKEKKGIQLFLLPPIYIIMHFAYSCGLIWALLKRLNKKPAESKPIEVNIRVVKAFQGV